MSEKQDVFVVEDMACQNCANTITNALNNANASNVETDVENKLVTVDYDDEQVDVEELLSALDNVGFPATIKKKP